MESSEMQSKSSGDSKYLFRYKLKLLIIVVCIDKITKQQTNGVKQMV